jgi:hypothetical protein
VVELHPVKGEFKGNQVASSRLSEDSYAFTHGGKMFQSAVKKAKEILAKRRLEEIDVE